jgi:hypothetical protein
MIRRDATKNGGEPVWLLIAQSEHASLASFLACHWAKFPGLSAAAREQLLVGILTHDNGWDTWEEAPALDGKLGRPLQFLEMPGVTALPIWTRSIDACEEVGPLAAYAASGHFSAMLEHHRDQHTAPDERVAVNQFLLAETRRRARCEQAWVAAHGKDAASELPLAVHYLQAFDAISLWFCCADRNEPMTLAVPAGDGAKVTFSPDPSEKGKIEVFPWPLSVPDAQLSAEADVVPATKYKDRAALQAARSERTLLSWELTPKA